MQLKVSDLFIFAIRRYSHVNGFTNEFEYTGYTTFKVYDDASDNSVKYYANEYMNSQKRYDYAMIEFVSDDSNIAMSWKDTGVCTIRATKAVRAYP